MDMIDLDNCYDGNECGLIIIPKQCQLQTVIMPPRKILQNPIDLQEIMIRGGSPIPLSFRRLKRRCAGLIWNFLDPIC
jgi:hypothetical protein